MSAFDDNPFGDPSIQQAASTAGGGPGLSDYDPFNKDQQRTVAGSHQPAVMSPTSQEPAAAAPPLYAPTAQQTVSNADFQKRQEELERKAAELARREEELKNTPYNARLNNWPPIPSFIPCQPCFYQDINVDIPVEFQDMVKKLYYLWLIHAGLLLANFFGGLCFLFGALDNGTMLGASLLYCFFFIPLSFLCWFRPAYKAFRNDSSMNFMMFFFIFFCQFCFTLYMALGIPGTGAGGFITAIGIFTGGARPGSGTTGGDYFIGFIIFVIAVGFSLAAVADLFMLTKIHGFYRASGATIAKAQAELTGNIISNEGVRSAAASAAAEGVRQGFQSNGNQQPRY